MNEQNFVERVNTLDIGKRTNPDTNTSVKSSDSFAKPTPVVDGTLIDETLMEKIDTYEISPNGNSELSAALFNRLEAEGFRTRWNAIQVDFVNEPRSAVQQADTLVSEVVGKIHQMLTRELTTLEGQWNQGNEVSTEEFRKTLQGYHSFFNRLVLKNEE